MGMMKKKKRNITLEFTGNEFYICSLNLCFFFPLISDESVNDREKCKWYSVWRISNFLIVSKSFYFFDYVILYSYEYNCASTMITACQIVNTSTIQNRQELGLYPCPARGDIF